MNTKPPSVNWADALHYIAQLPTADHDLLARELNVYAEAIRTRAGRTTFTADELRTLLMRMYDVARIAPNVTESPVDLDQVAQAMKPIAKPKGI